MANASIERFRKLTADLVREVRDGAIAELDAQADKLVALIEQVTPTDQGNLRHSVRKIPGSKPTQVRVVAGGRDTIKPGVSAPSYDHARAVEFGTVDMPPQPFFFPTYRLGKKRMVAAMKRKITASIKARSAA